MLYNMGKFREESARPNYAPRSQARPLGKPRPRRQGLLDLQRSAGNAAVQRLITGPGIFGKGGVPLAPDVRNRMESTLGGDLGRVRVHTDERSARSADALGASAFTLGHDVGIAASAYRPGTLLGDALLAHELAHVAQHDDEHDDEQARPTSETGDDEEACADRAAAHTVLELHGGPEHTSTPTGMLSRMRSGLRLRRCTPKFGDAVRRARAQKVQWQNGHPMTPSHGDNRSNPTWTPGTTDHAVAYSKGATPLIDASFDVGSFTAPPSGTTVSVRVVEGGAVRGTKSGITPAATISVPGLALTGLSGSAEVRSSAYTLQWEASVDGTSWTPITTTGVHPVHWTHDAPKVSPAPTLAVAKASGYAAGATTPGDVAARVRSGPRTYDGLAYDPADPIDPDPLDVYTNGVGICTDYANLLSLLARAVGLEAHTVMFWGGFESLGRLVWVSLAPGLLSLKHVKPGIPAFGNPGNPAGWDFTYHAIARVQGALHDAALDRAGIDADAVHSGLVVHLIELAGGAMPGAARGVAYNQQVPRLDHNVAVTTHDFGPLLTGSDFGLVLPLRVAIGAVSPYEVLGVGWAVVGGTLPPGFALDPITGVLSGTPTPRARKKTYTFTVQTSAAGLTANAVYTIAIG